jgi:hypothetical protein
LTQNLTAEGYLGLSLVMIGLLLSVLMAAKMLNLELRRENVDKDYSKAVAPQFFIYLLAATTPLIMGLLTVLISLFAPGHSENTPMTFGFGTFDASLVFYSFAAVTVGFGGFAALKSLKKGIAEEDNRDTKVFSIISALYIAAGAVFALLSIAFVATGVGAKMNADYVSTGSLYLLGAVLGAMVNWRFAAWFKAQIISENLDAEVLEKGTKNRFAVSTILFAMPVVSGLVIMAT